MAIRDWIDDYLGRHRALTAPHDWPDPASEEWAVYVRGWVVAFLAGKVTEAEADAASLRLAAAPPRWHKDHIPAVLATVGEHRGPAANPATDRDAALAASKDCPRCGGQGLAPVYHPDPKFARYAFSGHCTCPMGRWVRSKLADADRARIVDLDRPRGWLVDPPGFDADDMATALAHFTVPELIRDMVSRGRSRREEPVTAAPEDPRP